MSGQQSIIDKIILEAQERAQSIIAEAEKDAAAVIAAAQAENLKLNAALLEKAKRDAENIIAARLKESESETRRRQLSARFAAIEQCFDRAKKRLLSLSDSDYLDYVKKQIKAYAADNDTVVISSSDEKRITPGFINGIAKEMGINLTLSQERGSFEGGVILKGLYWDSNLTIESNFRVFCGEYEAEVSKMLSGSK